MLSGGATHIIFIVFCLTRPGLKPTIYTLEIMSMLYHYTTYVVESWMICKTDYKTEVVFYLVMGLLFQYRVISFHLLCFLHSMFLLYDWYIHKEIPPCLAMVICKTRPSYKYNVINTLKTNKRKDKTRPSYKYNVINTLKTNKRKDNTTLKMTTVPSLVLEC